MTSSGQDRHLALHGFLELQDCPSAAFVSEPQAGHTLPAGASVRWASRTSFAQKKPPEKQAGMA